MTDNSFGNDFASGLIDPLILEIYLNNNNYKDRILISDLKKRAHLVKLPNLDENSFFVKAEEMESILLTKFYTDIKEFNTIYVIQKLRSYILTTGVEPAFLP